MTLVHSCRKHKLVKGFCCWLYLACIAGVKLCRGRQSADEEVASSKKNRNRAKIDTLFMIKMAEIDTLFMTKTAEKPYPLGPHIPI